MKKAVTQDPVVIVAGARTPVGRFGGALRDVDAADLGATAVREALVRSGLEGHDVDELVMGQVGQVGADAFNARRSALRAGLPPGSTALNVNRLCASGLQAIVVGAQEILTGQATTVVAGGNESMSRQPFFDFDSRRSKQFGHRTLVDGTLSLITDPFGGYPMGVTAERVAARYSVTREQQDQFALTSQLRARGAIDRGDFQDEVVAVTTPDVVVSIDEHPRMTSLEALAALKPVFEEGGTVTAGNSSGMSDGAAAVILMRHSEACRQGLHPRLTLRGWAVSGIEPELMGYAPATAIPLALKRSGVALQDIQVIELNEAFAAQAVAVARDLDLDPDVINPTGGAIALGHPLGATGAILTVKLMYALERTDASAGMVAMCIGGGQGMAAVFTRD